MDGLSMGNTLFPDTGNAMLEFPPVDDHVMRDLDDATLQVTGGNVGDLYTCRKFLLDSPCTPSNGVPGDHAPPCTGSRGTPCSSRGKGPPSDYNAVSGKYISPKRYPADQF